MVSQPRPFSALYRLSCCGYRGVVLAVRADGERLSLTVAVPPGGAALAAWVGPDGGWVHRVRQGCRDPLPPGVLPISATSSLPLDPRLAAMLLSGLLPADAREVRQAPGWVEASTSGLRWQARVEGPQPHLARLVVTRAGEQTPMLTADIRESYGRVPAGLRITTGPEEAELVVQAWRVGDPPAPPPWLAAPVCGGGT
ncbi:MAG: hypothetical protein ACXWLL_09860 [Myxococcaceae bacterium]